MASNLRAKLPSSDSFIVYDVNTDATNKFKSENQGIEIANTVRDVAVKSVCRSTLATSPSPRDELNCSIYDLSWELLRQLFF